MAIEEDLGAGAQDEELEFDAKLLREAILEDVANFLGRPVDLDEEHVCPAEVSSNVSAPSSARGGCTDDWQSVIHAEGRLAEAPQPHPESAEQCADGGPGTPSSRQSSNSAPLWKTLPPEPKRPPPPPPPPPKEQHRAVSASDWRNVLDALEKLIASKSGSLPGTAFEELYSQSPMYKDTVRAAGGPKKFVEQHKHRFQWVSEGVPGGSVRLARQVAPPEVKPEPEPVLRAWEGGAAVAATAATVEPPGHWKPKLWSAAVPVPERGGPQTESFHQRGGAWSEWSDWPDLLAKLVAWHGGTIPAARVYNDWKNWRPWQLEAFKTDVESAGGIKKFVAQYPDRFQWVPGWGAQKEAICLAKSTTTKRGEFLDVLKELIRWHGGTLLASRIFIELRNWKPDTYDNFRMEVDTAGGLKKFAARYPDMFQWVSDGNPGKDAVRLLSDGSQAEYLDVLEELIVWHGGTLLASKLSQELKQWKPQTNEIFKGEVESAGGLKKFFVRHSDRFEWVLGAGSGTEEVRAVRKGPGAAAQQQRRSEDSGGGDDEQLSLYQ